MKAIYKIKQNNHTYQQTGEERWDVFKITIPFNELLPIHTEKQGKFLNLASTLNEACHMAIADATSGNEQYSQFVIIYAGGELPKRMEKSCETQQTD